MKAPIYTQTGEIKGEIELNPKIFNLNVQEDLIHQALIRQLANSRIAIAHTKTKGEIRGGGAKPYRQKGTGRARQGSIRNPHYKGGGVAFGPRNNRNFHKRMPKKQRRKALFCTLSSKAKDNQIIILENLELDLNLKPEKSFIKTKNVAELIKNLKIEKKGLFVLPAKHKTFNKASANIPSVKTILVNYLNIHDLLKYQKVIFFQDSLKKIEEIFLK